VLFDLDGTLIDSGWMILASFRHATSAVLGREIPDEVLMAGVGGTSIVEQMRVFDEERVDELVRVYRAHNEPLHDRLEMFVGMEELVLELHGEGRRLGIVTAKRRTTADIALDALGIGRYFGSIVAADSVERGKPHPEPVLRALGELGSPPGDAALVGDSPFDMGAARAAGVFAVGVAWGGIHDPVGLEDAGADVVVSSAQELRDVL
jgi:pyrophosphatase PpaX